MSLLAEDLLLLLLDDESGSVHASSQVQVALGGAVLAELALLETVAIGEKAGLLHKAKVQVVGGPPHDPVLLAAYEQVAEKERSAQDQVNRLGKGLKDQLIARLVAAGIVEERRDRVLGLFPRTRWPEVDSRREEEVRRALSDVLLRGVDPKPRTAALIALLSAIDQVHRVLEHDGVSNGEVKTRAKSVAEGQWAAKGVADAIAATNAAVMAAVVTSAAATAGTAS